MPAGDAQRAWFAEMLSELSRFWDNDPDWSEVIDFCNEMTLLRSSIWEQRGIKGPMMTCRNCGKKHAMTLPPISPRSLLFALRNIDVVTDDERKRLDKEWKRFRKDKNLNALGYVAMDTTKGKNHGSTCMSSQRNTS